MSVDNGAVRVSGSQRRVERVHTDEWACSTVACGGGVFSEPSGVVTNCMLTGNASRAMVQLAAGRFGGTLYNCTLTGNMLIRSAGRLAVHALQLHADRQLG